VDGTLSGGADKRREITQAKTARAIPTGRSAKRVRAGHGTAGLKKDVDELVSSTMGCKKSVDELVSSTMGCKKSVD